MQSSADINPIGSIDKTDLKRFIAWAEENFGIQCLRDFLEAVPTAELEPITSDYVQRCGPRPPPLSQRKTLGRIANCLI